MQILVCSILPRLDEFDYGRGLYDAMMQATSAKHKVSCIDVARHFDKSDRQLWSWRDGVHISEDRGIPLLVQLLRKEITAMPQNDEKVKCQEWMWNELKYHNPIGMQQKTFLPNSVITDVRRDLLIIMKNDKITPVLGKYNLRNYLFSLRNP